MKVMRLCGHDRCSAHWILDPEDERGGEMCAGGVFLPDDTLIIEKVDGEWPPQLVDWLAEFGDPWSILELIESLSVREAT